MSHKFLDARFYLVGKLIPEMDIFDLNPVNHYLLAAGLYKFDKQGDWNHVGRDGEIVDLTRIQNPEFAGFSVEMGCVKYQQLFRPSSANVLNILLRGDITNNHIEGVF